MNLIMPEIKETSFEPGASLACLYAAAGNVCKENLGSDREHRRVGKSGQKWRKKSAIDNHVVIEKDDNVRLHFCDASIVASGKAIVAIERKDAHCWKVFVNVFHTSVCAAVID